MDLTLTSANLKATMKSVGAGSRDLWHVDPRQIRIIPDFNGRIPSHNLENHIEKITASILESGYWQNEPLGVIALDQGDGPGIYVHAGHCRLDAVMRAIERGAEIETVPCVPAPKGTSIDDLLIEMTTQGGLALNPLEVAFQCKRLARMGMTSNDIAKRLGYASAQYVDNLLMLAAAHRDIHKMITDEMVSATTAIDALNKHGDKALQKLVAAYVAAGQSGRKVRPSDMEDQEERRVLKLWRKNAATAFDVVAKVKEDPAFSQLTPEVKELLSNLLETVK